MNPRAGTVETEEVRRPLSPFEGFHNFNFNVLGTIHNIVQGLLDILIFSTIQGCFYLGSLIEWVQIYVLKSGHKGRMKSKDLVTGRFLGQGCSGIFYETALSGSQESTVGLVRKDFPAVESSIFESEVVRLFELKSHPNIVKTLGWTLDSRSCSVVMERMRDDLSSIMRREKEALRRRADLPVTGTSPAPIKLLKAMDIALQIAIGMEYLHDQGIVHGDLKPNNVLVEYWDEDSMLVKLADYGLVETKRRTTLTSQRALCFAMIEWSAPEVFEDYFGSISEDLDYLWTTSPKISDAKLSPPMSVSDSISSASNFKNCPKLLMTKADSFSFALTCTYILVGGQVWDTKLSPHELRRQISCSGLRPKLPPECPEKLASLVSKCWDANPAFRPPFSVIRNKLQEIIKEQREGEVQWHTRNMLQEIIKEERKLEVQDLHTKLQDIVEEQREQEVQGDMLIKLQEIIKEPQEIRNKLQENVKEQQDAQQDIRFKLQEVIKEQQDIHNKLQDILKEHRDVRIKLQETVSEQVRQVEKDSSPLKPIDSVEDTSQLFEALTIIEDVTKTSNNFLMNKHQCERLANRLHAIGVKLQELPKEFLGTQFLDAGNKVQNLAFSPLLQVLRKAKALLSKYVKSKENIPGMLTRTEDREAFKEIHADLDMLNSPFHIGDFESTSASTRSAMLRTDADMDLKELSESSLELAHNDDGRQPAENITALEVIQSPTLRPELTGMQERPQTSMLRRPWTHTLGRPRTRRLDRPSTRTLVPRPRKCTLSRPRTRSLGRSRTRSLGRSRTRSLGRSWTCTVDRPQTWSLGRPQTNMYYWSVIDMPLRTESRTYTSMKDQIERSKTHWNKLEDYDSDGTELESRANTEQENREVFITLQSHPGWGRVIKTFGYDLGCGSAGKLVVGEKFAEGAEAELFDAHVTWKDSKCNEFDLERGQKWALKVFRDTNLHRLLSRMPHDMLPAIAENAECIMLGKPLPTRHIVNIFCATLNNGRFAFLMQKEDMDLRLLIDNNMQSKTSQHYGPFPQQVAERIMYDVALGMNWLHNHNIVHRDLKASNVLVSSKYGNYECLVADFECSNEVVGTGFFRAPEILQACRDRNVSQNPKLFARAVDAYSYGMTCYLILTGKFPFEEHSRKDFDVVLSGQRPEMPIYVDDWVCKLLTWCWQSNPADRPSFTEILDLLLANSSAIRGKAINCLSDD